jgi:23S rRNA-/tRNA-specific pseudouridylate synthase
MVVSPSGKSAESRVRPLASGRRRSLVAVSLREGRRHQIRVHLSSAGFPVAGDDLYGEGPEKDGVPRLMLHALWLRFRPGEGEPRGFLSEPPGEFRAAVKKWIGPEGSPAIDRYREDLARRG